VQFSLLNEDSELISMKHGKVNFIYLYKSDNKVLNQSHLKGLGHAILGNFSTDPMVIELTKISK